MTEDNISLLQKARSGDQQALEQLVENNTGLIWSVARRFFGRGYEPDDLFQLGSVGFLKAVQGFDLSYGTQFSTYAVPKITGEILRFLRDDSIVKVSRGMKERASKIRHIRGELEQKLGREPTLSEIAEESGLEPEEIAAAETATGFALSLQETDDETGFSLEQIVSDNSEERMLEYAALRQAVGMLTPREQEVIALRFYRGLTQQNTAKILRVSQVQVSRLERRAISALREMLHENLPNTDEALL